MPGRELEKFYSSKNHIWTVAISAGAHCLSCGRAGSAWCGRAGMDWRRV